MCHYFDVYAQLRAIRASSLFPSQLVIFLFFLGQAVSLAGQFLSVSSTDSVIGWPLLYFLHVVFFHVVKEYVLHFLGDLLKQIEKN